MQIKTLYKYDRGNGKITVSLHKPDCEYIEMCRIIADEGKILTLDDVNYYSVIDTANSQNWKEIEETGC